MAPPLIDDLTKRNLTYTKKLFLHGLEHAAGESEIDRTFGILHLDNAVERFLATILLSSGIDKPRYFPHLLEDAEKFLINLENKIALPLKSEILALHYLRNGAQHKGIIPSKEDVERNQGYTREFLTRLTKDFFELDFEQVSMAILVRDQQASNFLSEAEQLLARGKIRESMSASLNAFLGAMKSEQKTISGSGFLFPYTLLESKFKEYERKLELEGLQGLTKKNVDDFVEKGMFMVLGEEIEVLKLRMDYKKYRKFVDLFPGLSLLGDNIEIVPKKESCTTEDAIFALAFCLETVLRWEMIQRSGYSRMPGLA